MGFVCRVLQHSAAGTVATWKRNRLENGREVNGRSQKQGARSRVLRSIGEFSTQDAKSNASEIPSEAVS